MSRLPIVAIDGPAGAGKSTIAKQLAARLGFVLLDTGALYRSIALLAQREGLLAGLETASTRQDSADAITTLAGSVASRDGLVLEQAPDQPKGLRVLVDGEDVSAVIRSPEISMAASTVSAIPGVRAALLELQRAVAKQGGVVAEGRDIGTVVFPESRAKFFLTASLEVRAERRRKELTESGEEASLEQLVAEVAKRDKQDSERAVAPLKRADDAMLIDSTHQTIEQIVTELEQRVRAIMDQGTEQSTEQGTEQGTEQSDA
jgi:cytidylate kinase